MLELTQRGGMERELPERLRRGAAQVQQLRRLYGKSRPSMPRPGPNTTMESPRSCPWEDLITSKRQGLCPVEIALDGGQE